MKKLFFLLASLACILASKAQTVGIGTAAPDSTAILDIFSTDKGVLIPRIADTANVTNPVEGLIIYNKNTKTPYYYDGKKWLSMAGRLPISLIAPNDRITYTVTGTGFGTSEEAVVGLTQGVNNQGIIGGPGNLSKPSFSDFNFTKAPDINSKSFNQAAVKLTKPESIEFKIYAPGALNPYASYRLKNIIVTRFKTGVSAGGAPFVESVSFMFENYGFKDWVTNFSFGYDLKNGVLSAY